MMAVTFLVLVRHLGRCNPGVDGEGEVWSPRRVQERGTTSLHQRYGRPEVAETRPDLHRHSLHTRPTHRPSGSDPGGGIQGATTGLATIHSMWHRGDDSYTLVLLHLF